MFPKLTVRNFKRFAHVEIKSGKPVGNKVSQPKNTQPQ